MTTPRDKSKKKRASSAAKSDDLAKTTRSSPPPGSDMNKSIIPEIIEPPGADDEVGQDSELALPSRGVEVLSADSRALAPVDPLLKYLAEIKKYPLLTREQEKELALKYFESGDARAAEQLVTSNLRFVVKIAAEYSKFGAKLIDLIQEGNMGLMHAVREFNPYKGARLITYAVWWIRGYIQEYLMKQHSLVKIGTTQAQKKLYYNLKRESENLEAAGLEVTPALLSSRLGVSEEDVNTMTQRLAARDVSLNQNLNSGQSAESFLNLQTDPNAVPLDDYFGELENLELLKEKIEEIRPELNERELDILDHRILGDPPLTLQEVGDKYQVTREAVRQMEQRVISKIKERFFQR